MKKVLIDIPQEAIEKDAEGYFNYFGCMSKTLYQTLKNGTVLPDNPTNGDMINAMFPNNEVREYDNAYGSFMFLHYGNGYGTDFSMDWWNAPYERG